MRSGALLFSFGSNSSQQLRGRVCVSPTELLPPPRPALLLGHARVFAGVSTPWEGAVADVVPSPGHSVRGSLCALSADQLDRLDAFERLYARRTVAVRLADGIEATAILYSMPTPQPLTLPPSEAYLAACDANLCESWGAGPHEVQLLRWTPEGVVPFAAPWRRPQRLTTALALLYSAGLRLGWTLPGRAHELAERLRAAGGVESAEALVREAESPALGLLEADERALLLQLAREPCAAPAECAA